VGFFSSIKVEMINNREVSKLVLGRGGQEARGFMLKYLPLALQ
jgi:hypothetical protein